MFLKRQYKLIELIYSEKKYFTTKELAKKLECSTKTIQRDILQIKEYLPEGWKIEFVKNKGVFLRKPLNSSIKCIQTLCFKNSLFFKTLNAMLTQNIHTVEELSHNLYIQNTKMRSILMDIDQYLKQHKLTLKKRPLRIEGDELHIILMYYELYLKAYDYYEWPFKTFKQCMFKKILQEIESTLSIKFYKESNKNLSVFIALYLIRKAKKFHIPLEERFIKNVKKESTYVKIEPIISRIFKDYNIKICNEDIIIISMAIINHADYYYVKKEIIKRDYLSQKDNQSLYNNLHKLILLLEEKFHIPLRYDTKFISSVMCILKPHVYTSTKFIDKSVSKPTTIYMKNTHNKTFNIVTNIISTWVKDLSLEHHVSENSIADLTMHIESIKMQKTEIRKKIILFLNGGESWERYLTSFLNSYFNKHLEYLSSPEWNVLEKYLTNKNIACVITDTTIIDTKNVVPIISILDFPTQRDLEEISRLL